MRALGFGVALVLAATAASAQDRGPLGLLPTADAFHVSVERETDPVAHRVEGRVHNGSPFRVTDVRLDVRGLDANRRPVGQTFVWAIGDIASGGQSSFVFEAMPDAVTYHITVVSYHVVSGPPVPQPR